MSPKQQARASIHHDASFRKENGGDYTITAITVSIGSQNSLDSTNQASAFTVVKNNIIIVS